MSSLAGGTVSLRWRRFVLPMRHRFEAAHGAMEENPGVVIELRDGEGRTGLGEASPIASLGQGGVDDVVRLLEACGAALLRREDVPHGPGAPALRCALDVASLDLEARGHGVPVVALLTDAPALSVGANAVIGGGTPEEVARFGREAVADGYDVLKVKVGVGSVDDDIRRIAALREACPSVAIRLDANGAWDETTAGAALEALQPLGIQLIEQPVPATDVEALARVHAASAITIAADEAVPDPVALDRILEARAADLVVLKPMLLGGLRPALAIAERAAEAGIGAFVTTTFDSSIGTAASLHLAAALPGGTPLAGNIAHGLGTGIYLAADVVAPTLIPQAGRLALPDNPGLGVTLDVDALEAVAIGPWVTIEG